MSCLETVKYLLHAVADSSPVLDSDILEYLLNALLTQHRRCREREKMRRKSDNVNTLEVIARMFEETGGRGKH